MKNLSKVSLAALLGGLSLTRTLYGSTENIPEVFQIPSVDVAQSLFYTLPFHNSFPSRIPTAITVHMGALEAADGFTVITCKGKDNVSRVPEPLIVNCVVAKEAALPEGVAILSPHQLLYGIKNAVHSEISPTLP